MQVKFELNITQHILQPIRPPSQPYSLPQIGGQLLCRQVVISIAVVPFRRLHALFDPVKANELYHTYMDQLEFAEELGFDGIGVNEHHQNAYGIMPSPNIIAAGLARRTSKAALCVIGNSIALYNPPLRVAEEFAMLDVISGGRLVAGFPVGTSMDTNFCYGQIPALTRDKYAEAHDWIIRAWSEDEPFAFDGKYNQLRYVNCWPKPIQKPRPPVYIPGGGSIETWDFCLDNDYNYSYLSFNGYKAGQKLMDGYWERVAERGKDESPGRAAFAQIFCVADNDADAEKHSNPHVEFDHPPGCAASLFGVARSEPASGEGLSSDGHCVESQAQGAPDLHGYLVGR